MRQCVQPRWITWAKVILFLCRTLLFAFLKAKSFFRRTYPSYALRKHELDILLPPKHKLSSTTPKPRSPHSEISNPQQTTLPREPYTMCLRTWAVCNDISCTARTGLYKLRKCPNFDERTEICRGKETESPKLLNGDIPCLDCAIKGAAAKREATDGEKLEAKTTKKVK